MKTTDDNVLFDTPTLWQEEWVGMPEFAQDKQEPFAKIIFRFDSEEELQEFAQLIGQKLTSKTKSAWHPHKPHRRETKYVWTNED
jgi:hypothetical protein